jgi:hypothetical protein
MHRTAYRRLVARLALDSVLWQLSFMRQAPSPDGKSKMIRDMTIIGLDVAPIEIDYAYRDVGFLSVRREQGGGRS